MRKPPLTLVVPMAQGTTLITAMPATPTASRRRILGLLPSLPNLLSPYPWDYHSWRSLPASHYLSLSAEKSACHLIIKPFPCNCHSYRALPCSASEHTRR